MVCGYCEKWLTVPATEDAAHQACWATSSREAADDVILTTLSESTVPFLGPHRKKHRQRDVTSRHISRRRNPYLNTGD